MPTLYEALVAAGAKIENHASDLYTPVCEATRELLNQYPEHRASVFTSQIDGQLWYDVPFAFLPYWEAKQVNR